MAQSVGHLGRNYKPMRGGMAQSVGHLGRNFKPKRGGMAQSVEHFVHIMGRGAERRQWRMKRGGSVVSNKSCERQRSRTPIANLTERAKRSETVGSSPTVTTQKSGRRYESTLAGFFAYPFAYP